jgi:flagellar biosynthesis GTPase FlhF
MLRPSESSTLEPSNDTIRTYQGRTVEELIPKIQAELGSDAIILRRREGLTGGLAGFFQRRFVEIDAMAGGPRIDVYDEEAVAPMSQLAQHPSAPEWQASSEHGPLEQWPDPEQHLARTPFYVREPPRTGPEGRYVTGHLAALARSGAPQPPSEELTEPPTAPRPRQPEARLTDPFARMLEQASAEPSRSPRGPDLHRSNPTSPRGSDLSHASRSSSPSPSPRGPGSPRGRARSALQSRLLSLGLSERFAAETIDAAEAHILPFAPRAGLSQAVRSALAGRIPVAPSLPTLGATIVLVGPGGAGKTSCCAALLGAYRTGSTLPASCATLVRGPGKGDLRMLLSPQIRKLVAVDTARAARALRKARDEGLLVIDTPPLSPGDSSGIRKLSALLSELEPERVTIVMPATLGAVAAAQLLRALRPLGASALALTHADETDQIGVAVEAACTFGLAPEYTLDRKRSGGWRLSRIDPTGLAATLLP